LVKKDKDMEHHNHSTRSGKALAGTIIVGIGIVLLFKQMGFWFFPGWLFSWPMILIVIGLVAGAKQNFRTFGWTIPVMIGGFFLLDRMFPWFAFKPIFWPLLIIVAGLYLIFGRGKRWNHHGNRWNGPDYPPSTPAYGPATSSFEGPEVDPYIYDPAASPAQTPPPPPPAGAPAQDRPEFLKTVAILGGVKKNVLSKNVTGGEIVTFLGGSQINLTQADIRGRVEFEVTQIFGGTKLIVPSHWDISTEMVAVLGGIEDKRSHNPHIDKSKLLVIKGTSIFGGIEIQSYV
jgi:predicted membrane protein